MRLVSYEDRAGPSAGVLLGEDVVPLSALDAPSHSVRGILGSLDAAALAELGERAGALRAIQQLFALSPDKNERDDPWWIYNVAQARLEQEPDR